MTARNFLDLVRAFLTPSAPADSLAGFAFVAIPLGRGFDYVSLAATGFASVAIYWYGMASNDFFDRKKDESVGAGRPIAKGRISPTTVLWISILLALVGIALAAVSGSALVGTGIVVCATLYNAGLKRVPILGNLVMGSCRAGNFLLGAHAAMGPAAFEKDAVLLSAGLLGLFVAGITAVSVLEDKPYRAWTFHLLATPMLAIPMALALLSPYPEGSWVNGIVLLALLIRTQRFAASERIPVHPAAVFVRGSLGGIFFVDAGLVWSVAPATDVAVMSSVGAIYALALLGWWWKKRWLQSGGADT
ncbi:MAG: UbiA family prenyltransferase [Planctomycetota bacterium]